MPEIIQSSSNPRIRHILKLMANSRERKAAGEFIIEGFREISRALASGFEVTALYFCRAVGSSDHIAQLASAAGSAEMVEVGKTAFARIAYREGSDGIIAIAKKKHLGLNQIKLSSSPLILVLESVEKPGNLGAVLRTADAAGIDAVIICDPLTDIFNPNVIRSSVGCVFSNQVVACSSNEAAGWLEGKGITSYAAALTDSAVHYLKFDYRGPAAFIMGAEATGLSSEWLARSDHQVVIPMNGIADSLNVSTSAAILIFEACRQRIAGSL